MRAELSVCQDVSFNLQCSVINLSPSLPSRLFYRPAEIAYQVNNLKEDCSANGMQFYHEIGALWLAPDARASLNGENSGTGPFGNVKAAICVREQTFGTSRFISLLLYIRVFIRHVFRFRASVRRPFVRLLGRQRPRARTRPTSQRVCQLRFRLSFVTAVCKA